MKKIIFVISFIVLSGFLFGLTAPEVKAVTVAELQILIQQLQAQIAALQQQLDQLQEEQPVTWCHTFNVNLKIGDTGSEVTALQTALSKEGLYTRGVTGTFDEYTASAVVGFQEKYASEVLAPWGLTHGTGYVGSTTRAKLNKLYGCGVVRPYIKVLSPNGGEKWVAGNSYNITWSSTGVQEVYMNLVGPSNTSRWIGGQIPATKRIYSWKIPEDVPSGNHFKIVITDQNGKSLAQDESDNYFSIVSAKEGFCGDVNDSGSTDMGDVIALQNYVGYPTKYSISNKWAADVNCDGAINMGDVTLLRNYVGYPGKYVLHCCGGTCGDVNNNGTVNIGDSSLCYSHVKDPRQYQLYNPWSADVNCDKKIDNNDCNLIMNYVGYPGKYTLNCCSEKSITVISPNGGEQWTTGEIHYISWKASGVDQVDKILIFGPGFRWQKEEVIAENVSASQGRYVWTIPSNIPAGDYKIRLWNKYGQMDDSDNFFSIVSATTTTCTDSDGGNNIYVKGTVKSPTTGQGGTDCCAIKTTTDIRPSCTKFVTGKDEGNSVWEYICTDNGGVIGYLYSCPSGYTCSEGACVKEGPVTVPSITILSLNGGETLIDGNTYTISWQSSNAPFGSTVGLQMMGIINGSESWGYGLTSSPKPNLPSTGSLSFTARTAPSNTDFKIRATLFAAGAIHYNSPQLATDTSDNPFKIVMPTGITRFIKVVSPNGGESLEAGKTYQIKWISSGIDSSAKIEIRYRPTSRSSELGGDIIITTNNTGNYNWAIPDNVKSGQYLIEMYYVTEYNIYGASGLSDNYFSIVSATTTTCTDSDGGRDYYVRGKGTGLYTSEKQTGIIWGENSNKCSARWDTSLNYTVHYDCCSDAATNKQLNEAYCDANGLLQAHAYFCPYGCKDGACVGGKLSPCDNYGDVNEDGYITDADATAIKDCYFGKPTCTTERRLRADVNNDGLVDTGDVTALNRYITGLDSTLAACSKTSPCDSYGDLNNNGFVNLRDSELIKDCYFGKLTCTKEHMLRADVNNDGLVDTGDVTQLKRYITGLDSTFPVCEIAGYKIIENQLASLVDVVSGLIEQLKGLIGR